MYACYFPLKYLSSSNSRSCGFRLSSAFTIWRHCSTWSAWCWIYFVTSSAVTLASTEAVYGGQAGHWNYCPVVVWYVAGCIARLRRQCFPPTDYDWMVDTFAWILQWISGWFCSWWPPHIFLFSWKLIFCEYLQVWKSFLLFGFTKFGVLEIFWNSMALLRRFLAWIFCAYDYVWYHINIHYVTQRKKRLTSRPSKQESSSDKADKLKENNKRKGTGSTQQRKKLNKHGKFEPIPYVRKQIQQA